MRCGDPVAQPVAGLAMILGRSSGIGRLDAVGAHRRIAADAQPAERGLRFFEMGGHRRLVVSLEQVQLDAILRRKPIEGGEHVGRSRAAIDIVANMTSTGDRGRTTPLDPRRSRPATPSADRNVHGRHPRRTPSAPPFVAMRGRFRDARRAATEASGVAIRPARADRPRRGAAAMRRCASRRLRSHPS